MDFGVVVPAAVMSGIGLLKGAAWARRVTGYTCLAVSVATMAIVMYANADPDAP